MYKPEHFEGTSQHYKTFNTTESCQPELVEGSFSKAASRKNLKN